MSDGYIYRKYTEEGPKIVLGKNVPTRKSLIRKRPVLGRGAARDLKEMMKDSGPDIEIELPEKYKEALKNTLKKQFTHDMYKGIAKVAAGVAVATAGVAVGGPVGAGLVTYGTINNIGVTSKIGTPKAPKISYLEENEDKGGPEVDTDTVGTSKHGYKADLYKSEKN